MNMTINEKARKTLIENLEARKKGIKYNSYKYNFHFPIGCGECYFCLLNSLACDHCEYCKEYGRCATAFSSFKSMNLKIVDFKDSFDNNVILGYNTRDIIKSHYQNCIEKISKAKDVNEIMMAKKELLKSICYCLCYEITNPKIKEVINYIESNYWIDTKYEKDLSIVKISDLKNDVKDRLIKMGYSEEEEIMNVKPQFILIGQKVKVCRPISTGHDFIGYLIRPSFDKIMLISENHTVRWSNPIEVKIINNDRVSIKSFESLIAGYKYELIDEESIVE